MKLFTKLNLGELSGTKGAEYQFVDAHHQNTLNFREAKDKLLDVISWDDINADGWYRQIFREIIASLLAAHRVYKDCDKPQQHLLSKSDLTLHLPACILKDLCVLRYEFLNYVDVRSFLNGSELDEDGLAGVLVASGVSKGDVLLYIRNMILSLVHVDLD